DQVLPQLVPVERLVGDHLVHRRGPRRGAVEQAAQQGRVAGLAGGHVDRQRRVLVGGGQEDLAGQATPAAADALRGPRPLRPPVLFFRGAAAGCWGAGTRAESTSSRRTSPKAGSAVRSSNSAARLPEATQRRKRLYTASQRPNSDGRSRHGMPVRARYRR